MKRISTLLTVLALLLSYCLLEPKAQGQLVTTEQGDGYASLTAAIDAIAPGAELTLQAGIKEDVNIYKNVTLDLNGFSIVGSVNVASGCTLTVKDSQTDDYTVEDEEGYGKLTHISGDVVAANAYLKITDAEGVSFHRIDLELTSVTLRPETVGIYYNGEFYGDEIVTENVDVFGIALRLDVKPDASYMRHSSAYSWYDDFLAGAGGNTASGALLKNVMRKGRPTSDNRENSQRKIYGAPYIRTADGRYIFGTGSSYSLMQVMQKADSQWNALNQTQKNAIKKMYNSFESIISTWYLPNINDTDIDIPI